MLNDSETHLFLLRVWARPRDASEMELQWCGKLQEVVSTRGGYFGDWTALVDLLREMLPDPQSDAIAAGEILELPDTDGITALEEDPS